MSDELSTQQPAEVEYRTLEFIGFPDHRVGTDGSVWTRLVRCPLKGAGGKLIGMRWVGGPEWRRMVPQPKHGHLRVLLSRNGLSKQAFVHVLVLEAFVGPRPPGTLCRHYPDPTKTNCDISNLQWGTPAENCADDKVNGVARIGEQHGNAKLTDADAIAIREKKATGHKAEILANEFNVSTSTIYRIVARKAWKHL